MAPCRKLRAVRLAGIKLLSKIIPLEKFCCDLQLAKKQTQKSRSRAAFY
ncbi:MAG: hypothetical protein OFPII_41770 [Osedax symbiont Rs1]|nr:MAG: hypothetical protein OFPII_41770 [Osedax symbiont Rs1]